MIELAADIASWISLTVGAVFCVIGGIGLIRLPDLYTRTHAAAMTDSLGAGLILLGLAFQAGPTLVSAKLGMVFVFMTFTGAAAAHALVKAAYAQGVKAHVVEDGPARVEDRGD